MKRLNKNKKWIVSKESNTRKKNKIKEKNKLEIKLLFWMCYLRNFVTSYMTYKERAIEGEAKEKLKNEIREIPNGHEVYSRYKSKPAVELSMITVQEV